MSGDKKYWLDEKRNVDKLYGFVWALSALLVLLGLFLLKEDETHFGWERWFGFYGFYGFVACFLLVLAAKYVLRGLVKRDEDYYDR